MENFPVNRQHDTARRDYFINDASQILGILTREFKYFYGL